MESATNFNAAVLSSSVIRVVVFSSGTPSRGLGGSTTSSSALEDMLARDEARRGRRVCDEDGSSRGVEVFEFRVEEGSTRFARRNEKKAVRGSN
jgi:hypothetical protein